ncbi:hypothetical protein BDF22DRAFT_775761 [Syncephalis plumigaleata]|nr:hypothetical protein BDF22DRAFT_775761 [Syncephalis plumigaleata]
MSTPFMTESNNSANNRNSNLDTASAKVTASVSRDNARASTFGGRGNTRAVEQNRRPVFKATLDAAYNIYWPSMQVTEQEKLMNKLCPAITCVGKYHAEQHAYRKACQHPFNPDKSHAHRERSKSNNDTSANNTVKVTTPSPPGDCPPIANYLCTGLASVTRVLEREARRRSSHGVPAITDSIQLSNNDNDADTAMSDAMDEEATISSTKKLKHVLPLTDRPLKLVIVCRADMSPPHMYAHLPMLAYRAGRVPIALVPAGSESRLATALNIRRVAVMGIKSNVDGILAEICNWAISQIRIPAMPWLDVNHPTMQVQQQGEGGKDSKVYYVPTRIKQLRTSMPIRRKKTLPLNANSNNNNVNK